MKDNEKTEVVGLTKICGQIYLAFAAAGMDRVEADAELASDPGLAKEIAKAAALSEVQLINHIRKEETGAGARWLLERMIPEKYGARAVSAGRVQRALTDATTEHDKAEPDTALARAIKRRQAGAPRLSAVPSPRAG